MKGRSSGPGLVKEIAERKPFPAVTVVLSADEVRRRRVSDHLFEVWLGDSSSASAITRCRGQDLTGSSLRSILLDLQMGSLFHPVRFWVIERADQMKAGDARDLSAGLGKLPSSHHVVIHAESLPATNPLRALGQSAKTLIELPELKGADLSRWVERELASHKLEAAEPSLIETFIQLGEGRPDQISKQIDSAALFVQPGESLTSEMIRDLFPGRHHPSDYDLLDALTYGDYPKAERLLQSLEADDRSPYMLISFLTRCWGQLTETRHLLDRGLSETEIRNKLGLSPWIAGKITQQSRRLSKSSIASGLETLLWADSRLKGKGPGASAVLSQVAWRLTNT